MPPRLPTIHQLKISLKGARPPIWRRIQVPSSYTLAQLHDVLQRAMGWTDSHLHQFIVGKTYYMPFQDEYDFERTTRLTSRTMLKSVLTNEKSRIVYEYDFGDSWEHDVLVEKILPPDPTLSYPRCLAGKRACPPEDCGGIWGYSDLLEVLGDPEHPEREERLEWLGAGFDPEAFSVEAVDRSLRG